MTYALAPLSLPLWRMIGIRHQFSPTSGEGARLYGGRWNRKGRAALYLAADPVTAVAEYYQGLPKPGTLVPYRLVGGAIADLTNAEAEPCDARVADALAANWKALALLDGKTPPSWTLADELIAAGAEGALVPSTQNVGGRNLVLWQWHEQDKAGEGAALTVLDPDDALRPPTA
ncbi:RES domain-containing protein [Sphingobium sp. OAS761]|jgi:RES domain-containing protein|uniref:RES family NAD+ phosphorylase n=1 Tax=Sphingobium sp. OAS761 TaxID=2817901 RepID=UPI00209D4F7F|nr:RES family NAD+ phosphorylase [Sphingobium sp. OAS761]MCP1471912.1 RES domain-containing protein [Sphingobium sp. OAS761]